MILQFIPEFLVDKDRQELKELWGGFDGGG